MDPMRLHILTPSGPLVDAAVSLVRLPGSLAPFGVLPGHAPISASLERGEVAYVEEGVEKRVAIASGFVEVLSDQIDVCAEV